ncbi:hypothetical protein niasHT_011654 [Heterodera trifolii]|uniref:Transcription factor TFIIIB component B'' Myb domain-containing protein n=1 Tax=Heterodera trifolii TaxID=157864 RepID=A0ABD2LJA9_9BILA
MVAAQQQQPQQPIKTERAPEPTVGETVPPEHDQQQQALPAVTNVGGTSGSCQQDGAAPNAAQPQKQGPSSASSAPTAAAGPQIGAVPFKTAVLVPATSTASVLPPVASLLNRSPPSSPPLQLFAETDPMLCGGGGMRQHLYIDRHLQPRAYTPEALAALDNAVLTAAGHQRDAAAIVAQHQQLLQGQGQSGAMGPPPPPRMMTNERGEMVSDQRTVVVVENTTTEPNTDMDTVNDLKEKRKVPTSKDKLVDRKRFTMSDLVRWKPKTENTLKRKWAERRRQLKEDTVDGETTGQPEHQDQQQALPAVTNGGGTSTNGNGQQDGAAPTGAQPQQGPSNASSTPTAAAGPRVMINERGEMVVDEQSLVVIENPEQNTAGMETVNDDLLPKRITSLSFRRKPHRSSMWGVLETDLFYEVLSATGTDFGLMHEFIPTRTRVELKNKFNREERINPRRLNEALLHPTMLDERLRHRVERMLEQMADQ